jgi:alpha-tubulin suppressor-like RCC1 family protein
LGIKPPPEKQLTFREISGHQVMADKSIKRVIAKDYHSIAVGEAFIYVWGTNGGQFGMKKENNPVILPKELPLNAETKASKVKLVESSNAAIVCYTESKFLYIFSSYKMKSYKNPL